MKAEIKDKTKEIGLALRCAGLGNADSITVEIILNVVDMVREHQESGKDTTIKQIIQKTEMVKSLFED